MGLTKPTHPQKNIIELLNAAADFAGLINNPADAKKVIIELVSLSKEEMIKVEEAKAYISKHYELSREVENNKNEAIKILKSADSVKKLALDISIKNEAEDQRLKYIKHELDSIASKQEQKRLEHIAKDKQHIKEKEFLESEYVRLSAIEKSFREKNNEITAFHEKLKEKAKLFKSVAQDF